MTLSPYESRRVKAVDDGPYPLNDYCQHPDCDSRLVEKHHLERRSSVGDTWWVEVEGQGKFPNIVNLCNEHHRLITDNEARIWWDEDMKCFQWMQKEYTASTNPDPLNEYGLPGSVELEVASPLDPQPGPYVIVGTMEGSSEEVMPDDAGSRQSPDRSNVTTPAPGKECNTCGRRMPYPKTNKSPKSKTWSVRIPLDGEDYNVDFWNDAVADAAKRLGIYEEPHWKFRTMFTLLHEFNEGRLEVEDVAA